MKIIKKIKKIIILLYRIILKYKLFFIIAFCVILFIFGLVRDIKKNKNTEYIPSTNNDTIVNTNIVQVKITGGVNSDYTGPVKKGTYLFEIIESLNNGLTTKAIIDSINLCEVINSDYELNIEEDETTKDNSIEIIDYATSTSYIYRYNGRVDNKIIIYKVNSDITDSDYELLTKGKGTETTESKLNINTATLEQLIEIGLGKSKSEKLIAYREENGKFTSIEDITKVSGIGEATLEKVRDKICVN